MLHGDCYVALKNRTADMVNYNDAELIRAAALKLRFRFMSRKYQMDVDIVERAMKAANTILRSMKDADGF
jgi:hypothetical protein